MGPETLEACYQTLGLTPDAKYHEIKHAYRTLVKCWHPDRFATTPLLTPMLCSGRTALPQTSHAYTGIGGARVYVPCPGLLEAPGVLA